MELQMEEVFTVQVGCFLGLSEQRIKPGWVVSSPCTVAQDESAPGV